MTITDIAPLLRPFQAGQLRLRNRFVMPGMQRGWCVDGAPGERLRDYYRRRALGGAALVISEACAVDHPSATSNPLFARINATTAEAWRACAEAVHEAGGLLFLQLWHQGAVDTGKAGPEFTALSPSGLAKESTRFGRSASSAELSAISQAFARGAAHAREIGADGVEVHACHGYLLDQFLWRETNRREDRYGGAAIEDRAAFPAEVIQAVRAAAGPDFPVSVRISQWKELDYEAKVAATPADDQRHLLLGLSLAYLGRYPDAVREAERGAALLPISKDARNGAYNQYLLARVYLLAGQPDKAMDVLEQLLKVPFYVSPAWLRIDPEWTSLKGNPRFERLSAG